MTTIEAPPDTEWSIPDGFAAHWGVATTELPGDDGRVAGLVFTGTARQVPQTLPRIDLPHRQLEVLRLMANGLTNVQIGVTLGLSEDTIKTHARALFRRLRADDRAHAVAIGFRTGNLR